MSQVDLKVGGYYKVIFNKFEFQFKVEKESREYYIITWETFGSCDELCSKKIEKQKFCKAFFKNKINKKKLIKMNKNEAFIFEL